MNHITSRREFQEAADAYMRARTLTPQLLHAFATSFAQLVADDCKEKVAVVLPGNVKVERRGK